MGRTFVVVTYELAETIIEVLLGCCSKLFKPGISFAESSRISFFPTGCMNNCGKWHLIIVIYTFPFNYVCVYRYFLGCPLRIGGRRCS